MQVSTSNRGLTIKLLYITEEGNASKTTAMRTGSTHALIEMDTGGGFRSGLETGLKWVHNKVTTGTARTTAS